MACAKASGQDRFWYFSETSDITEYMKYTGGYGKSRKSPEQEKDLGAIIAMIMRLHLILQDKGYISHPWH